MWIPNLHCGHSDLRLLIKQMPILRICDFNIHTLIAPITKVFFSLLLLHGLLTVDTIPLGTNIISLFATLLHVNFNTFELFALLPIER